MAAAAAGIALAACGSEPAPPVAEGPLTLIGQTTIDPQPEGFDGPLIGGLSSIFHVGGGLYYMVSDDRGEYGPARYYTAHIPLSGGRLDPANVAVMTWAELRDADGEPFAPRTYDLEGLVAYGSEVIVSSEGDAVSGSPPFVAVFGADLRLIERLGLPPLVMPSADGTSGARPNLALESLTMDPGGRYLFTATEVALAQDGPVATIEHGSNSRILRFNRQAGVFDQQYLYVVEPVHAPSAARPGSESNGLAELVALSDEHLLAMERSFAAGAQVEHSIKLFEVCLEGADDIAAIPSLAAVDVSAIRPARKRLMVDLATLVPELDNAEGLAEGPRLRTGERTLLVVSDDNFNPAQPFTQILAFRLAPDALVGCAAH